MSIATAHQKHVSEEVEIGSAMSFKIGAFVMNATGGKSDAVATALANTTIFPINLTITTMDGLSVTYLRDKISAKEVDDGRATPWIWDVEMAYVMLGQSKQPYPTGATGSSAVTTFEIGTQSVNLKQSYHTDFYPAFGSQPDFHNQINVDAEGNINGVDVDVPTFNWSETAYVADADMTTAHAAEIYNVASRPINDDTFRDFPAGSVKFGGVQGTRRAKGGDWELNFRFSASPNVTGLTVGSITGIAKTGWQYLWVYQQLAVADYGGVKYPRPEPAGVYVEDIFESIDFSALGIGTA